ncbi:MAG: ferritin-like domain-containing protein [Arcticibacter sp.]
MNILNIIDEIEKVDTDVYDRINPRRGAMKSFMNLGSKLALSALPLALGSMFNKAYGQNTSTVVGVLQFALTLEYLEAEFYDKGLKQNTTLIPAGPGRNVVTTIAQHEAAHVKFLQDTIKSLSATPVTKPTFDFTAKGTFADVFTNYDTFLAVAQAFEDTGVRAYKGQAGNLKENAAVLTAALNIHSVEARHASHIRQMRKARGANVKPWITLNQTGIGSAVDNVYAGEENTQQAKVQIVNINGSSVSASAASESFDEPLTQEQVLAIVGPFLM